MLKTYPCGSKAGVMYGLPKIQKEGVPVRRSHWYPSSQHVAHTTSYVCDIPKPNTQAINTNKQPHYQRYIRFRQSIKTTK